MKAHYRAIVIGGGVVGASVLYHLAKLGWSDIALIERRELTAGSTWHAAAGFHAINADPNIARLQDYTIKLYKELEAESGQAIGLHGPGGISLAGSPARWEWLQSAWAVFQTMGVDSARLVTPDEIAAMSPITDVSGIHGGLYDTHEGHLDPYGTTVAYVTAARKRGADLILRNRVVDLQPRPDGAWSVVTEHGTVVADHVVNAAGLWAKQVGLMAGTDLPVTPMEHHYLVTEAIPEIAALGRELPMMVDLEGFTYLRQEGNGLLLGIYESNPKHWNVEGAPWDYGIELIPEDVERIADELELGFRRFPCLHDAGIKKWVNGAFTFTPDGNPLVGPVPGLRNYWVACGVMAGFSQGGGIGLALAQWMVTGEPQDDVFGMDIARYGAFASNRAYLKATTAQFYSRRFVLTYPNEQLPAGRPLKTPPIYDVLSEEGARWGVTAGLELPLYFAPRQDAFTETPTLRRSNAHGIVASEAKAARSGVVCFDTTAVARYEVTGPRAAAWLDGLLACTMPTRGRTQIAPMLSRTGRLLGDLTVTDWDGERFWLMGSYHLRRWHGRYFAEQLPASGVTLRDVSEDMVGVAIAGPQSRALLGRLTPADLSEAAFPFMAAQEIDVGLARARVVRLSITGELGYAIHIPASEQRALYGAIREAGRDLGLRPVGHAALDSLRLEKSFGVWSKEFTWSCTPGMSGLDRFVAFDKPAFVGREAARRERQEGGARQRLVTLEVDAADADASGFEPVWIGDRRVGFVTSGGFGHTIGKSLAMAYLDVGCDAPGTAVDVHVVGERRRAQIIPASPVDPEGRRFRQ